MRVAIVGSRGYPDMGRVRDCVRRLADWGRRTSTPVVIVSGTEPGSRGNRPPGVDEVAVAAARGCGLETAVHAADWANLGKRAGILRNATIVEDADAVVAFWDFDATRGTGSRGTADAIDRALARGNLRKVYGLDGAPIPLESAGEAVRRVLRNR